MKKCLIALLLMYAIAARAQKTERVRLIKDATDNRIDVLIGQQLFTRFLYPDTLEKPVLYPVCTASGKEVTRGFPLNPQPADPVDHPHHIGIWFNYENVNGLDFWNNSYAIPPERKSKYGWIKVDSIMQLTSGEKGVLTYRASWRNEQKKILLEEVTELTFSAVGSQRIIDRKTDLKAFKDVVFTDVKDGLIGFRLAHALQIPDKKHPEDIIAKGNYISSAGLAGDSVWGTRAAWCKAYGKMGKDSVAVVIIDHPKNVNYPTFWHARGYGLFAANPLGEKIFTKGRSEKNLVLKPDNMVTFRYRIVVDEGRKLLSNELVNKLAKEFAGK